MEREFTYDAFISYRHTALDKAAADKLQKLLERYSPPASVRSEIDRKKLRLFRDETELSIGNDLSEDIKTALENSRFLIVLCSKTTAQSAWCLQEITYFKELHDGSTDNIIVLMTEGNPSEDLPSELCTETRAIRREDGSLHTETVYVERLVANISAPAVKDSIKKLKREYLRIAAPLFGCRFYDLYKRNQKRVIRRVITISAILVALLSAFATYSSAMVYQISSQRNELAQKTIDLESKTVELNETNTELIQKNDELDSVNSQLEQTNDDLEESNIELAAKTTEAEENLIYANSQKSEAEKNLEYANQQKTKAEKNLEYANRQKVEAEKNLAYANEQKELAEINEANTKKANHELRVQSSVILTAQAKLYFDDGDRINAIKAAIGALPIDENDDLPVNTTAEYLLSKAASIYSDSSVMMRKTVDTSGYIAGMKYSDDGSKLLAYDTSNNIYLIDTNSDEVTKTYSVVNDFHTVGSSSEIMDIVMEEEYAYILYSGGLACINPIDETIQWYIGGLFYADMIKTNRSSEIIAVKTFDGIYFINKNGTLIEEFSSDKDSGCYFSLGDNIKYYDLDRYTAFVDENGYLFICTGFYGDSGQSLLLIKPDKRTVNAYSLNLSGLLSMAELDGNIIISAGTKYEGKIVCYYKNDLRVKWEIDYDSDRAYLSKYQFNKIFRHNALELWQSEEKRDVVCVISGESIVSVDYKTGELLTNYSAHSEIKDICYLNRRGFVGLGVGGIYNFCLSEYLSVRFASLHSDEEIEHMAYGSEDKFAFTESNSSKINTYKSGSRENQSVELAGSDTDKFDLLRENGYGVIAYFDHNYNNEINSLKIYDTNKREQKGEISLNSDKEILCLEFVNADKLVICDDKGSMYLYDVGGHLLDQINFSEKSDEIAGNSLLPDAGISFSNSSILASNQGDRFICRASEHLIYLEISMNTLNIEEIIDWPWTYYDLSKCFTETNFRINSFSAPIYTENTQGDTEYLHNRILFVDDSYEVSYMLDGDNEFTYDRKEVSDLLLSNHGEIIAFIKIDDYVGIYSIKDKLLRKIKFSAGNAIPKSIVFTPDDRFLLAFCHNGNIIRYSLLDLSISDQIKIGLDASHSSCDFEFIGNNEVIISGNERAIFVNYGSMMIRAEIADNYVGFIHSSRRIITYKYSNGSKRYTLYYYKYLSIEELIESAKRFAEID
ncbi:MAG: TIR domain-containing protein [Clostridiales bacterium]|nr:TIR domain-containing protein [Clostridiales bacterium]